MKKKTILLLLSLIVIAVPVGIVFRFLSYDINNLPDGTEISRCISPDGNHTLILYESETSLSAAALRGEILDNSKGKRWNIYWQYRPTDRNISWKDNDTVIINEIELNIYKDRYDYRRDSASGIPETAWETSYQ